MCFLSDIAATKVRSPTPGNLPSNSDTIPFAASVYFVVVYIRDERAILEAGGRRWKEREMARVAWLFLYWRVSFYFREGERCELQRYMRANAGKCISVPEVR
jgi:NADH dehydrogenase FAD-containing subunit